MPTRRVLHCGVTLRDKDATGICEHEGMRLVFSAFPSVLKCPESVITM